MRVWHTKNGYSISCIMSGRSNVFLLTGNGKHILIDTSPGTRWNKLKGNLLKLGINKIDLLILTHTHYDHAENSSKLKKEFGATIVVNKLEEDFLRKGRMSIPKGTFPFTRFIVKWIVPLVSARLNYEPCLPDIISEQHFNLNEFGFNAYILHTPGHSPGSQSVIIDDEIALAGDSMFGIFPGSIFPPYADNEDEMIRSWGKLLQTGCYVFIPSHGTPNSRELVQKEYQKRTGS